MPNEQSDGSSSDSESSSDASEDGSSDEESVPRNTTGIWPIDSDIILAVPSPPHSNENQNAEDAPMDNDVVLPQGESVIRFKKPEKSKAPLCGEIISARLRYSCLTDHSYYQNRPHNLENLGIQTPSESEEEEIDVVNYDNVHRLRSIQGIHVSNQLPGANNLAIPVRRPRGRPRNSARRRSAEELEDEEEQPDPKRPRRRQSSQQGAAGSSSQDLSSQDRRDLHNRMEKERRITLKNLFDNLREEVPNIKSNSRTSKVAILTEATEYIKELRKLEKMMEEGMRNVIKEKRLLRAKLMEHGRKARKMRGAQSANAQSK
ncbi:PREDICTED: protein L-Myc-1a-like [Dinoponera quadriceps]|uniref:Protein L-Myc-1a-like n=1 Tax=Dinoponera quadriceps TaxID=609295 RepID=A0A6P3X200_DINQU|nr:PREDICTED: protein L-Myc-1a-like [Dinoponera quadriceps]